jgi:hypothetical protein
MPEDAGSGFLRSLVHRIVGWTIWEQVGATVDDFGVGVAREIAAMKVKGTLTISKTSRKACGHTARDRRRGLLRYRDREHRLGDWDLVLSKITREELCPTHSE